MMASRLAWAALAVVVLGCGSRVAGGNGGSTHWLSCEVASDCPTDVEYVCEEARCVEKASLSSPDAGVAPSSGGGGGTPGASSEDGGKPSGVGASGDPGDAASAGDAAAGAAGEESTDTSDCPTALTSGDDFTCALLGDGRVVCFGNNEYGQLGASTQPASLGLVDAGVSKARMIAAGRTHVCATSDSVNGELTCWGDNSHLQLEGGLLLSGIVEEKWLGLFAGANMTCGIDTNTHAVCWGSNDVTGPLRPQQLAQFGIGDPWLISDIALGDDHVDVLGYDGNRYTIAYDGLDQAVRISSQPETPRLAIAVMKTEGLIVAEEPPSAVPGICEVKASGSLWCDGAWIAGLTMATTTLTIPAQPVVAAGVGFVCALDATGQVFCAGDNTFGTLGTAESADPLTAVKVSSVPAAVAVTAGKHHACAITKDGSIWCWGAFGPRNATNPFEVSSCSGTPFAPMDVPLRTDLTVSDYADAAEASYQAQCRCDNASVDCGQDHTPLSVTCLVALADSNASDAIVCETKRLWDHANAACEGTNGAGCQYAPVLDYCSGPTKQCTDASGTVSAFALCDGTSDCADGSDELNCTPGQAEFRCDAGKSIPLKSLCDGAADCANEADETSCGPDVVK